MIIIIVIIIFVVLLIIIVITIVIIAIAQLLFDAPSLSDYSAWLLSGARGITKQTISTQKKDSTDSRW